MEEPTVRSYRIRGTRITGPQQLALDTYWDQYGIEHSQQVLDIPAIFPTSQKVVMEIGFGMGEATALIARDFPDTGFFAVDVHRPGVGKLFSLIQEHQLKNLRVIQGDGVNQDSIRQILQNLKDRKISACNIVFGMGGKLLQADLDRDTMEAAMKCSSTTVNGRKIDVYKQPITDSKKNSKRGELTLVIENGEYKTIRVEDKTDAQEEVLQLVYENGKLYNIPSLDEIRQRVNNTFIY